MLYERFENAYGEIFEQKMAGTYLVLDNGEIAFSYDMRNLARGEKVLCTVIKPKRCVGEGKSTLVSLDSVIFAPAAA